MSKKDKAQKDIDMDKPNDNMENETMDQEEKDEARSKEGKGPKSKKKKQPAKAEELEELKIQYAELNDKFLRLFADFDNYRKNCNKDKIDLVKTASQRVIEGLLPVLDDFDRAIEANKDRSESDEQLNGFMLIYNKLFTFLKQQGLQPMDSLGKEFDTDYHDAVTQIPAPSDDMKGKVVDVIQKGYLLNDKIIRHAKVVVGQ
jgi:molecular chaperone GrpE